MDARAQFARTACDLIEHNPAVALVYAEISGQFFEDVERHHPERVINVGIREQLLVNVGAGMALTGLRPIVHTFGSFLVERAFEQIKLGFGHQQVGGVLVGSGGSFDIAGGGRTHQSPGDVALLDTCPGSPSTRPATHWRSTPRYAQQSPTTACTTSGSWRRRTPPPTPSRKDSCTSYAGELAQPWSRSAQCSTTSWPRPQTATSPCFTPRRCGRSTRPACGRR